MSNDLLKVRVKGKAKFRYFCNGSLFYSTDDGWVFPVPVEDTMNAQGSSPMFMAEEKGITLMRWIRKAMEAEAQFRVEAAEAE